MATRLKGILIDHLKGAPGYYIELDPVTFLRGENASGKSTVLDAIALHVLGYHPTAGRGGQPAKSNDNILRLSDSDNLRIRCDWDVDGQPWRSTRAWNRFVIDRGKKKGEISTQATFEIIDPSGRTLVGQEAEAALRVFVGEAWGLDLGQFMGPDIADNERRAMLLRAGARRSTWTPEKVESSLDERGLLGSILGESWKGPEEDGLLADWLQRQWEQAQLLTSSARSTVASRREALAGIQEDAKPIDPAHVGRLRQEHERLQTAAREIADRTARSEEHAQQELDRALEMQERSNRLAAELAQVRAETAQVQQAQPETAGLHAAIEEIEEGFGGDSIPSLKASMQRAAEVLQAAVLQRQQLTEQRQVLDAQLGTAVSEAEASLRQLREQQGAAAEGLQSEIQAAERRHEELAEQLRKLENQCASATSKVQTAEAQLREAEQLLEQRVQHATAEMQLSIRQADTALQVLSSSIEGQVVDGTKVEYQAWRDAELAAAAATQNAQQVSTRLQAAQEWEDEALCPVCLQVITDKVLTVVNGEAAAVEAGVQQAHKVLSAAIEATREQLQAQVDAGAQSVNKQREDLAKAEQAARERLQREISSFKEAVEWAVDEESTFREQVKQQRLQSETAERTLRAARARSVDALQAQGQALQQAEKAIQHARVARDSRLRQHEQVEQQADAAIRAARAAQEQDVQLLQEAQARLAGLREQLARAETGADRVAQLATLKERETALLAEQRPLPDIAALRQALEHVKTRTKLERERAEEEAAEALAKKDEAETRLNDQLRAADLRVKLDEAEAEFNECRRVEEGIGPKGLIGEVIDEILLPLTSAVNACLAKLGLGEFRVRMFNARNNPVCRPGLLRGDVFSEYETLSDGERASVEGAFQVGLANLGSSPWRFLRGDALQRIDSVERGRLLEQMAKVVLAGDFAGAQQLAQQLAQLVTRREAFLRQVVELVRTARADQAVLAGCPDTLPTVDGLTVFELRRKPAPSTAEQTAEAA